MNRSDVEQGEIIKRCNRDSSLSGDCGYVKFNVQIRNGVNDAMKNSLRIVGWCVP